VSSYGRNTFTRGTLCLRLVWCPLYTLAAATCPGAPHLRYRSSLGSSFDRVAPFRTSRPCRCWPRTRCSRPARSASGPLEPSLTKYSHLCIRCRRLAPPRRTIPAQQNSRDMSSISVSVKPMVQKSLRVTETARELRSSAWPDVDEASEGRPPDTSQSAPQACVLKTFATDRSERTARLLTHARLARRPKGERARYAQTAGATFTPFDSKKKR
jgi:hypothetical protein